MKLNVQMELVTTPTAENSCFISHARVAALPVGWRDAQLQVVDYFCIGGCLAPNGFYIASLPVG